jgi:LPXTG-site transpeptidase (sortase) family protein
MEKKRKRNIKKIILRIFSTLILVAFFLLITVSFIPNNNGTLSRTNPKVFNYKLEPNHIIIPKIELNEQVYKDPNPGVVSDAFLNKGPCYYDEQTDKPGISNCVITGHSAVTKEHKAPFTYVNEKDLGIDDEIILTDKDTQMYKYIIYEIKIVASTDFSVVSSTERPTVTLITCIAPDYPRDKRLIIRGWLK